MQSTSNCIKYLGKCTQLHSTYDAEFSYIRACNRSCFRCTLWSIKTIEQETIQTENNKKKNIKSLKNKLLHEWLVVDLWEQQCGHPDWRHQSSCVQVVIFSHTLIISVIWSKADGTKNTAFLNNKLSDRKSLNSYIKCSIRGQPPLLSVGLFVSS